MFELRARILRLDIGNGMRAAVMADQQAVALRIIAGAFGLSMRRHLSAIGVLRFAGGDALGDDTAFGVAAEMDHLGAAIDLLISVRHGDGIKLALRIVAAQNAAGIFPGDRRAGLDLRPGDMRVPATAIAALGDEIIDAALARAVAGIPVLHRRIFDLRVVQRH